MTDELSRALEAWQGVVSAPLERLELDWQRRAPLQPVSADRDDRRRPIACTAFGGTSLAAATSLLELWRLGYAPAPLDLRLLPKDLAHRLRLVQPRRIFVTRDRVDALNAAVAESGLEKLEMHVLEHDPAGWPQLLPAREARIDDPGLIVFTSGTTGVPKAVLLTRANLWACAIEVARAQRLSGEDVALNPLSLAHVNAPVIALLATVLSGGRLVLMRQFDPRQFWQLAAESHVTWANLVPPLISMLIRHPVAAPRHRLRFVRSASAPLPVALMEEFERTFEIPVVESYGISEASSQVTINEVPPGRRVPGSVGRPAGVAVTVIDEHGNPLPAGQPGEVLVSGRTVMKEYLGDPEATGQALSDGRLRTGDLGTLDADGYLRLVGRKNELINRGGEKIAPRVVEEVLLQSESVADVAVVGVPHPVYGEEIKAFVVLAGGSQASARELLHFAAERLPLHSRPRLLQLVEAIPRNPAGKVLRQELVGASAKSEPGGEPGTSELRPQAG